MSADLLAIRARLDAATDGPWDEGDPWSVTARDPEGRTFRIAQVSGPVNADFIAHAPTDIAALLSELGEAEAERDAWIVTYVKPWENEANALRARLEEAEAREGKLREECDRLLSDVALVVAESERNALRTRLTEAEGLLRDCRVSLRYAEAEVTYRRVQAFLASLVPTEPT